ncbi:MAG: hypothetical protein FVQ82_06260 [Planctomycetes bacterium]|nr:hypothetical protein [Planctomycetota bacterium]
MTRLRMFYRMLGIAEHIIDPSFYHLLGLDRKDCNQQTVMAALLARKNELRQNAPGREFVPQIMEFEKEYLEPAAKVLADDVKRAKYDKVLAKRWHKVKHETEKRARLVGAVRLAITNAIDAQGALSASGKDALGEKLKYLGVEEHNVAAILAKIPLPLFETGEHSAINVEFFHDSVGLAADGGGLDESDKTRLFALADRLNIDKDKAGAAIDGASGKDAFRIQKRYLDEDEALKGIEGLAGGVESADDAGEEGDAEKIHLVSDVLDDEEQVEDVDEAVNESEAAYAAMEKRWQREGENSGTAFKYIAIVVGLIVLVALAYYMLNRGGGDVEDDETTGVNNREGSQVDPDSVEGGGDPTRVDPGDGQDPGRVDDPVDGSTSGQVREVSAVLSDAAKVLVVKDFTKLPTEELLSDTVVAMAASCGRASVFAWQSHLWNAELHEMLAGSKTADVIAARVVFGDGDAIEDVEVGLDDDVYEQLGKDISSTDKHVRYYAIERLKNDGSRRAAAMLLGKPVSGFSGGKQMISRRLRGLRQINKPYIAMELAGRIGVSPRGSTAHYICLGLIDMTGITPSGDGVLPAKNDLSQREKCSAWWKNALKDWKGNAALAVEPVVDEKLAGQVSRPGRLVAAAAYYCKAAAGELAVIGWGVASGSLRQRPASGVMGKIRVDWDSEVALAEAAAKLNVHLEKALRKLDRDKKFADDIDLVRFEGYQSRLAAKTGFQKAAATIETSGQLLEILLGLYYPDGRFGVEIKKIRSDREADIKRVSNVLQEIRQHAMYNLRLFDMLLQEIDSAAVDLNEILYTEGDGASGAGGFVFGDVQLKLRTEKMQAFGELAVGLDAYLAGRLDIAVKYLAKSLEYGEGKYVRGVFHSEYSGLLDDVIADCNSGAESVCRVCGGTEVVDCSSSFGIGWNLCRECRGTGTLETSRVRGRAAVCASCGGLAAVNCKKCLGGGISECPDKDDAASGHGVGSSGPDKDDVKRALAIALYLKKGGADIYSKGALE